MKQINTVMKPAQVVQIFENIFVDKICISPYEIGLDKNTYSEVGMDSLDSLEVIMELEKRFDIKIPDNESNLLMGAALSNYLNTFVDALVKNKRLNANDATIIKTKYKDLLHPNKPINDDTKSVPKTLLDEYKRTVAYKQELENKIKQYQK